MDEHSSTFRLNGGRFYRQTRLVKKRRYGPYWYCRSGWGKISHLGTELPPDIIAGQQAQAQASALLCRLDTLSSTLRRFVRGDVMTAPERATLQSLGISLADALEILTQAHPDPEFVSRSALGDAQTSALAQEVLSTEERELLIRCGLGRLVCVPPTPQDDTNSLA